MLMLIINTHSFFSINIFRKYGIRKHDIFLNYMYMTKISKNYLYWYKKKAKKSTTKVAKRVESSHYVFATPHWPCLPWKHIKFSFTVCFDVKWLFCFGLSVLTTCTLSCLLLDLTTTLSSPLPKLASHLIPVRSYVFAQSREFLKRK